MRARDSGGDVGGPSSIWPTWPSTRDSDLEASDSNPVQRASVLVASLASAGAAASALLLRLDHLSAYRFCGVNVTRVADLDRVLRAQAPRLLLLDCELAQALGTEALLAARRTSSSTDWMILWHESTPRGFELAVACQARGCIDWQSSAEQFLHAFRTVIGGSLWFPRRAMESLYFSLLAASQPDTARAAELDLAAVAERRELSDREVEVMELMRRGLTNQQIADRLGVSINTVKKHLAHAFEKRGLHHRRQLLG